VRACVCVHIIRYVFELYCYCFIVVAAAVSSSLWWRCALGQKQCDRVRFRRRTGRPRRGWLLISSGFPEPIITWVPPPLTATVQRCRIVCSNGGRGRKNEYGRQVSLPSIAALSTRPPATPTALPHNGPCNGLNPDTMAGFPCSPFPLCPRRYIIITLLLYLGIHYPAYCVSPILYTCIRYYYYISLYLLLLHYCYYHYCIAVVAHVYLVYLASELPSPPEDRQRSPPARP